MKVHTQNIFKYSSIKEYGLSKNPIKIENLIDISSRTKLGKFLKQLENILNSKTGTLAILDYNKYGYVSFILELPDLFEEKRKDIEQIGRRSNY